MSSRESESRSQHQKSPELPEHAGLAWLCGGPAPLFGIWAYVLVMLLLLCQNTVNKSNWRKSVVSIYSCTLIEGEWSWSPRQELKQSPWNVDVLLLAAQPAFLYTPGPQVQGCGSSHKGLGPTTSISN